MDKFENKTGVIGIGKFSMENSQENLIYRPKKIEVDRCRFNKVVDQNYDTEKILQGIGTLGEKTIHEVVKNFYCNNPVFQEIKIGRYVADIAMGNQIVEIQNGNFNKLRGKLTAFLPKYEVLVVYPIPVEKKIYWLDPENLHLSTGHKSPKKGNAYDAFLQLYRIKPFLNNPNLHFHFFLLDMDEFRMLNGWSADKKRGSSRYDRLPGQLQKIVKVERLSHYEQFFPDSLPTIFTSEHLAKTCRISKKLAQYCLLISKDLKIVEENGKIGRYIGYKIKK